MSKERGFTLAELLVALALISMLASLTALQSIHSYRMTMQRLRAIRDELAQDAARGKAYRHIISNTP